MSRPLRPLLALLLALIIPSAVLAQDAEPSGELVVSLSSDPASLFMPRTADRTASNTAWSLYNSLVWIDDDGNIVPALATSWDISDDGTQYVF